MNVTTELYTNEFNVRNDEKFMANKILNRKLGIRINFENETVKNSYVLSMEETKKLITNLNNSINELDKIIK